MPKKLPKRNAQLLVIILGSLLLLTLVGASWFPRRCPLVKQLITTCPTGSTITLDDLPPEEKETQRITHLTVDKDYIDFTVKAQTFRATTDVYFTFRGDYSKQVAFLNVRNGNNLDRIALVSHPLLQDLNWQRYSTILPNISMYQKNSRYTDPLELKANLPAAKELLIDSIVAKAWGLNENQYTLLDSATSLNGVNYIVTTYSPLTPDNTWRTYRQTFDFSQIQPDADGNIFFLIYVPNVLSVSTTPFLLSPVRVDYRTMR